MSSGLIERVILKGVERPLEEDLGVELVERLVTVTFEYDVLNVI